jgi:hypothetical protein
MYEFASLLYNRWAAETFIFQTTFRHQGAHHTIKRQTKILFSFDNREKNKLTFILQKNRKCNIIGCARTPRSFFDPLLSIIYFDSCVCMSEIKHTRLYTILAIAFHDQMSVIGFLSCKIKSVLNWYHGVTWKSLASLLKKMKTCSMQYTTTEIRSTMWN